MTPAESRALRQLPVEECLQFWDEAEKLGKSKNKLKEVIRELILADLYYLLVRVCGRKDMLPCVSRPGFVDNDFAFKRCREVQSNPNGYLDLWAREHWKSSIITFGLTIHDILNDPETTFGFFSHTRPIAKAFLRQIQRELESNKVLHQCFPDILWGEDTKQSPKWALAEDTPILTKDGWKRHGDLIAGDRIYGSDGKEITVTGNSGPMDDVSCFRVIFDDCELIASEDHLWPVQWITNKGGWKTPKLKIQRTKELRTGKNRRMLPTPVIHHTQRAPLEIAPYLLGLWLGDGTAGTNIISMHRDDEDEVLSQLERLGEKTYIHRRFNTDNFSMYGVKGLKERLEKLGCLRKKEVPDEYLLSIKEERLCLLQGLMDSDGTCKKDSKHRAGGMCMFSNTNKQLADSVFHLASSLGLRPSRISFQPKPPGRKVVHHIYFVGIKSIAPFRLHRKLANCKEKRVKVARYIRAIEPFPSVTVNCIKVDAADSLYLAGESLVPTHNSEDDGIIVKRKSNPNEATIEAWGLVDGQPTSKHFKKLLYDDVVVAGSVTNEDMISKVMVEMERSYNLGTTPGIKRAAGTRWHYNDAYRTVVERGTFKKREYPGKKGNSEEGDSIVWDDETHRAKRKEQGPYTYAAQILLNPKADSLQGFQRQWLRHYKTMPLHQALKMSRYLICDPASKKKKKSDYTSMGVIGLGTDLKYYLLDGVRDRLNLTERASRLFEFHRKWKIRHPVRYEQYGMQADIEHIKSKQETDNYRFDIVEVGGQTSKEDRIGRLVPVFEQGNFYLPEHLWFTDYEKVTKDLIRDFVEEEFVPFPLGLHDDFLDMLARILEPDLKLIWPKEQPVVEEPQRRHSGAGSNTAWMA